MRACIAWLCANTPLRAFPVLFVLGVSRQQVEINLLFLSGFFVYQVKHLLLVYVTLVFSVNKDAPEYVKFQNFENSSELSKVTVKKVNAVLVIKKLNFKCDD